MKIREIIQSLEKLAPPALQEPYDNAGLLVGDAATECTGIMVSLDVTEQVIEEAAAQKCNLIVAHHPVIFKGLKKLTGATFVERTVLSAVKGGIAIYAIHTNLDNVLHGVNSQLASRLQLKNCRVLSPAMHTVKKLITFAPQADAEKVRAALFENGAGAIGDYDECSFNIDGTGTFKAEDGADPYVGKIGKRHEEPEVRIEVIFPTHLQTRLIAGLKEAHPYEEVAYYIHSLENEMEHTGSGLVGDLEEEMEEIAFLKLVKNIIKIPVIKHTILPGKKIKRVAFCGGAGIFLLPDAKAAGAQVFLTGDIKYHDYFEANGQILLADIGHYESEQFTIELLVSYLQEKFPNFAVRNTGKTTNPIHYLM